jgi:sulfite reductase alpha subunit-like flavoprotein
MKLSIFYGTETGNCRELAGKIAAKAVKNDIVAKTWDLAECMPEALLDLDHPALIIISTWDEGLPPPDAIPFCDALTSCSLDFSTLRYHVLALGDEDYTLFCECGKQVDTALAARGAKAFLPRTDLGGDFLVSYIAWSKKFWAAFETAFGTAT